MSDEWWPSLEEYNPEISKEKWLEILADRNLTTEQNLHILACLYDFGGEATCTQLAQKYGETKNTYNSGFSNYAKRLVNTKICSEPPFRSDESSRWWPVLFVGHDAEKDIPGSYVWKLREELKDACKEYNILRFLGKKEHKVWLLTWNPKNWDWEDFMDVYLTCKDGNRYADGWSCQSKQAHPDDEFYLMKLGQEPRGIFAHGFITSDTYEAAHYDPEKAAAGITRNCVDIEFDKVINFEAEDFLAQSTLLKEIPEQQWSPQGSGIEIKKAGLVKLEKLWKDILGENDMSNNSEIANLLLNCHNLILHGAPGTGKTHLAKEIAKELNAEVGFVQFHPSYDYTDFVEGLRPIYNSERDVVFERKNGVFKGFCLSALETIKNKNKSESNLIEEDKIKKALKQFIDTAIEEQCYFFTKTNAEFTITAINEKYIFVQNVANEKYSEIKIKLDDILSVLLADEITEISEIKKIVGRDVSRQEDSYNFCIAKLVNLFINEGTIKLGVLSEKELNSALDLFRQECEKSDSGIVIKSSRSNAEFTTKMDDGVLVATSSKINGFQRINITGVKRYLNSLQFNQHQTYEPSVGEYILNNKEKYFSNNEPFVEIRIDVGESNSVNIHEEKENYVFIIDEINRGELSKIFGELFFNIDPGYRGLDGKINTQYQNLIEKDDPFYEGFYIPDNVYIIGTMNDIDRSVESMDFAFRRRFTFKEITAEDTQESILAELDETIRAEAIKRMNSLNNKIWHKPTENEAYEDQSIEGLSSAYHIGGAYFLKLKELNYDFDKLWEYHLSGLLREYLRGMEDAEELLEKLHKAYNLESQE